MNELISKLKQLAVAHEAALNFDYCPNESVIPYLYEHISEQQIIGLAEILNKYEGWSPSDIESEVFRTIEKL